MSADNWTVCPRCEDQRQQRIAAERRVLDEAYGTVPVAEFDRMRAAVEELATTRPEQNFREDYEFSGAYSGTVGYTYSGRCTSCSLTCSFDGSELFYEPASPLVQP